MSNILSIETATNACSVGLLVDNAQYARFEIAPRKHADLVLPMTQSLLKEAGVRMNEVDAIAFGCGPGSFMGVRLAVGIAQGLAFGVGCPVISVSTLQTLAQTAYLKTKAPYMLVGWDARMGDVYMGRYAVDESGIMQPMQSDVLVKPSEIDISDKITYIAVGNAWSIYENPLFSEHVDCYPEAQAMLAIAQFKLLSKESCQAEAARAHYCRHQVVHTNAPNK